MVHMAKVIQCLACGMDGLLEVVFDGIRVNSSIVFMETGWAMGNEVNSSMFCVGTGWAMGFRVNSVFCEDWLGEGI